MKSKFFLTLSVLGMIFFGACAQIEVDPSADESVLDTKIPNVPTVQPEEKERELIDLVETVKRREKTVSLFVNAFHEEDDTFTLSILIQNPLKQNIVSARTWLTYNPNEIEILEISESDFDLAAPGENEANTTLGLVKLGRSKTGLPLTDENILMAKVRVKKLFEGTSMMDFYNYGESEEGNTQVNIKIDDEPFPVNLLQKPPSPAVVIQ